MFCTDISESSNCGKISLGHGVPGTILQMPPGCGPSKYAVAKSLLPSEDQVLPGHLQKRYYSHKPVIYDLTFDYDWIKVPRDLGDTQLRIDFSNEVGYWDQIVDKAASKKHRKRSLRAVGGNHKRWLEEEYREDVHFGGLSRDELHKRWFGSDVLDWLNGFFNPSITREFSHNIDEIFTAKIVDERWSCNISGVDVEASILAQALMHVQVSTSFGFTLITKLSLPLDLSQSYLYFTNNGEVTATFTLEALAKVAYNSGDREILQLPFPGATFRIPKLVTIGPNFRLLGSMDASLTLSATIESQVDIAKWNIQQTLPDSTSDWNPKAIDPPDFGNTGSFEGIQQPTFHAGVTAEGQVTAHLKPTFEFGIRFDDTWNVGAASAAVVADSYVRFMAAAGANTGSTCPFTYGIDIGANLYTIVEAPSSFGWAPRNFPIISTAPRHVKPGGTCPVISGSSAPSLRTTAIDPSTMISTASVANTSKQHLTKRVGVYGPPFHLPKSAIFCPNPEIDGSDTGSNCATISGWEQDQLSTFGKRDITPNWHWYDKRTRTAKPALKFCEPTAPQKVKSPTYDTSGTLLQVSLQFVSLGRNCPNMRS